MQPLKVDGQGVRGVRGHGDDSIVEDVWFQTPRSLASQRRSSAPPPPPETLGEFLGDPMADAWLR